MKKIVWVVFIFILSFSLFLVSAQAAGLRDRLKGYVLLQVQAHGEAWYVNPQAKERVYMKNGAVAYEVMRHFGLGVSNANLAKIPVGIEDRFICLDNDSDGLCNKLEESLGTNLDNPDSDNDGYLDGTEVKNGYNPLDRSLIKIKYNDKAFLNRVRGYILLQVESRGEAWYVNPKDGKRYYMTDGAAAYQIMRYLSLGISNNDLATIPISAYQLPEDNNQPDAPICGNNIIESGEQCDGSAPSGYTCSSSCQLQVNNSSTSTPPQNSICGNNIIESGEQCDGSAPSGYTCNSQCQLVVNGGGGGGGSNPPICGNGVVESGEQCDQNAGVPEDYRCNASCRLEYIGSIYDMSLIDPYIGTLPYVQSDAPEGSEYQWKINNQVVDAGTTPTLFLAHYDANTKSVGGDVPTIISSVSYEAGQYSQAMLGRVSYNKNNNIDFNQGTIELWLKFKRDIADSYFDTDAYILKYRNNTSNDIFALLVHDSNVINFTIYDHSRGWSNAVQLGTGQYQIPTNEFFALTMTWSLAEQKAIFYLNGEQIARRDYTANDFPTIINGLENLEVGNQNVAVDELRVLNQVLNVDQVKQNYKKASPFFANEVVYNKEVKAGQDISMSMVVPDGNLQASKNSATTKINITSPDGYFVPYASSFVVQFATPSSMICRYGTEVKAYEDLPNTASGTGTTHSLTISVNQIIEPYPVAIKCKSTAGSGDDYGFYRQYRVVPQIDNKYPKLSKYWQADMNADQIPYYSKFDLINFTPSNINKVAYFKQLRQLNPEQIVLLVKAGISVGDYGGVPFKSFEERANPSMRLRSSENSGQFCMFPSFPHELLYNINSSQPYIDVVAEYLEKDMIDRLHYFDGIFWDSVGTNFYFLYDYNRQLYPMSCDFDLDGDDEDLTNPTDLALASSIWSEGMHQQVQKAYNRLGRNMYVEGNGNPDYHQDYNGRMWEESFDPYNFAEYFNPNNIQGFSYWQQHSLAPHLNENVFANGFAFGTPTFYRYHRFGMASSLMAGIYYTTRTVQDYTNTWWFDEFWVDPVTASPTNVRNIGDGYLGEPLGNATEVSAGVWRRDFEKGIVLVNSNYSSRVIPLNGQFRYLQGTQDAVANPGGDTQFLTLSGSDGRILLRSLCSKNPLNDPLCINK